MSDWTMPERKPHDGAVAVRLFDNTDGQVFTVAVEHNGNRQSMLVGEHNAARLVAVIALMLGMNLGRKLAKAIKL